MSHAQLITSMEARGIAVSPFMHYWTIGELTYYFNQHTSTTH